nr:immunoglobulin light chain junction region [Macaca mulatta]
CQQHKTYPFTF